MNHENNKASYEVAIIGGGVIGTALLYVLSKYTDIHRIVLVERRNDLAQVSSHYTNNSQTLHFGDIETNYTLEKATQVKAAAELVKHYLLAHPDDKLFYKSYKMVLAVGDEEVRELEKRHDEFLALFPSLKRLGRKELEALEPNITRGRAPHEKIAALYSDDGYAVNYQELAKSFVAEAMKTGKDITLAMNTEVKEIRQDKGMYSLSCGQGIITARFVVTSTGGMSLLFAKRLGYGENLGILPVAGNFYRGSQLLKGKVYTMQLKKLPFAAVHGDASVDNPMETRFGPTAKVLPLLERHNNATFTDFFRVSLVSVAGLRTLLSIMSDWTITRYVLKNLLYDIPVLGKYLFLSNVKKIIPSITNDQISLAKGYGAVRPQLVNMQTRQMEMGEAKITGDNIIFNITPSPGASVCLRNAERDAEMITQALGKRFDKQRFLSEHGVAQ